MILFTARKRNLGQGNVFTPVCHSVHRGRCIPACNVCLRKGCLPHQWADTHPFPRHRDGHINGWYASYWNAFYFFKNILGENQTFCGATDAPVWDLSCPQLACFITCMHARNSSDSPLVQYLQTS